MSARPMQGSHRPRVRWFSTLGFPVERELRPYGSGVNGRGGSWSFLCLRTCIDAAYARRSGGAAGADAHTDEPSPGRDVNVSGERFGAAPGGQPTADHGDHISLGSRSPQPSLGMRSGSSLSSWGPRSGSPQRSSGGGACSRPCDFDGLPESSGGRRSVERGAGGGSEPVWSLGSTLADLRLPPCGPLHAGRCRCVDVTAHLQRLRFSVGGLASRTDIRRRYRVSFGGLPSVCLAVGGGALHGDGPSQPPARGGPPHVGGRRDLDGVALPSLGGRPDPRSPSAPPQAAR